MVIISLVQYINSFLSFRTRRKFLKYQIVCIHVFDEFDAAHDSSIHFSMHLNWTLHSCFQNLDWHLPSLALVLTDHGGLRAEHCSFVFRGRGSILKSQSKGVGVFTPNWCQSIVLGSYTEVALIQNLHKEKLIEIQISFLVSRRKKS